VVSGIQSCANFFAVDLTMQDETSAAKPPTLPSDEEQANQVPSPRTATTVSPTTDSHFAMQKSDSGIGPHIARLVAAYEQSDIAKELGQSLASTAASSQAQLETLGTFKRASLWGQFRILSGRSFKNLYRNPMLMLTHYAVSLVLGSRLTKAGKTNKC
jgi:hypothetical protein